MKLLSKRAKTPTRANKSDAGFDLYIPRDIILYENELNLVDLEISVAVPEGHTGLIFNRSSNSKNHISLANSVGVIDSGYRGSVKLPLIYRPNVEMPVAVQLSEGRRVAQLVVVPIKEYEGIEITEDLPEPADSRGSGGFGSSGE